jgi:hypothetical protein
MARRPLILNRHPFLIPPKKKTTRSTPRRGFGQVAAPTTAATPSPTIPIALLSVGGVALIGGVVGAYFSEPYRDEFVGLAALGLVADLAGALWLGSQQSSSAASSSANYPVVQTSPGIPGFQGQASGPYTPTLTPAQQADANSLGLSNQEYLDALNSALPGAGGASSGLVLSSSSLS